MEAAQEINFFQVVLYHAVSGVCDAMSCLEFVVCDSLFFEYNYTRSFSLLEIAVFGTPPRSEKKKWRSLRKSIFVSSFIADNK